MSEANLKGWNHQPDTPLTVSPLFQWPLRPMAILRWFWNSWFLISEKLVLVGIAFASMIWFPMVWTGESEDIGS